MPERNERLPKHGDARLEGHPYEPPKSYALGAAKRAQSDLLTPDEPANVQRRSTKPSAGSAAFAHPSDGTSLPSLIQSP
jgi:hypothetical protein